MTVDEKGLEAVAAFLKERDEALMPGEADDAERLESAQAMITAYESARSAEPVASEIGEEGIARAIELELGVDEALLSDPLTLRRLKAQRIARAVLAIIQPALERAPTTWRHKKRGGLYEIVGEAQIQTSHPLVDYEVVVVYRSLNTPDIDDPKSPIKGELWARPKAEFHDGRFEPTHPAPEASDV